MNLFEVINDAIKNLRESIEAKDLQIKRLQRQGYMEKVKAHTQGYTEGYNKGITFLAENLNTRPTPPMVFGGSTYTYKVDNSPCTAELEVKLNKLVAYFEKRSKENEKRAEKNESDANRWNSEYPANAKLADRSGYYFSGKADSYKRAAEKLKELLK